MSECVLKDKINTSVPVRIVELPNSEFNLQKRNEFVTHAQLQMFYVGETKDRRKFTQEFSDKLLKTLPQSPVVGYYDEESEDFKAHNTKQYVYGYVPETATVYYDVDAEGKKWAFTDVILFTGRKDNIGEVASKIIGMQHSLELDPDTVQYVVNKDGDGKLKNIEFTDGKFVGLSVVGDSENPAFTGSHFFGVQEGEQMAKAFKEFQSDINAYFVADTENSKEMEVNLVENDLLQGTTEGTLTETVVADTTTDEVTVNAEDIVDNTVITEEVVTETVVVEDTTEEPIVTEAPGENDVVEMTLHQYMKETYAERFEQVAKAVKANSEDGYVLQMSDADVVYVAWTYDEEAGWESKYFRTSYSVGEEGVELGEANEVYPRYLTKEEIDGVFTINDEVTTTDQGGQDGQKTEEGSVLLSKGEAEQFEKDMAELQAFRKEHKEELINSFKGLVEDTLIEETLEKVNEYTTEQIESKLSVAAMKKIKAEKEGENKDSITPFKIVEQSNGTNSSTDSDQDFVNDILKRK